MIAGLEILNLHAQGGMAEVFRARGKGADGKLWFYAVKRILPGMGTNETLLEMFVEEARVASMLVHPNIVRVYDLTRAENGDYYIVMEFLEGHDVAEVIGEANERKRVLPLWLAVHAAREVLQALVYATTQATDRDGQPLGLIHRDISPPNIFLCSDGQVKLTDFGVAKVAQSQVMTQVGVTKGKFGYMSPEQLTGETLDCRSDLYNVGILLYEMITARRLFMADTPSMFLQTMIKAEVPPIERSFALPYELEALMRRALSRDRAARPETAAVFLAELSRIATRERLVVTRANVAAELGALFTEATHARAALPAASETSEQSVPAPSAPAKPPQRFVPEVAPVRPPMRAAPIEPAARRPPTPPQAEAMPPQRVPTPPQRVPTPPQRVPMPPHRVPTPPPEPIVQLSPRVASRSSHRAVPLAAPLPAVEARPEPTMIAPPHTPAEPPRAPPVPLRPERPPTMKVQLVDLPSRPERPPTRKTQVAESSSSATPRPSPIRPGTKQVRLLPEDDAAPPAPSLPERAPSPRATAAPPAEPPPDDPSTVPPEATAIQLGLRDAAGSATVKGSKRVVPLEKPKK